jgi:hypothetical protein
LTDQEVKLARKMFDETVIKANNLKEMTYSHVLPPSEFPGDDIYVDKAENTRPERIVCVGLDLSISFNRKTFEIIDFANTKFYGAKRKKVQETIKANESNGLGHLSGKFFFYPATLPFQAVEKRAKEYLSHFGLSVPSNYKLTNIRYAMHRFEMWEVEWQPVFEGFSFYDLAQSYIPSMSVSFDEKDGLVGFGAATPPPWPQSKEIKIDRDEAILKASQIAPLVEKTRFYRRCRVPGFVVDGIEEIGLKVVFPNWLLDPEKASWGAESRLPTESRICWVVKFNSRPGSPELAKKRLIPPDFVIYIDASTGECVGADFS